MKLLAISYLNIWPFHDQWVTVNFPLGKYLVKAPIGSWKSFLFFDGPVFALYKQSTRPLLSRKAKQWFVHLLFKHAGDFRFIERQIKPTKSGGDSVSSRLYKVDADTLWITAWMHDIHHLLPHQGEDASDILFRWVDIKPLIEKSLEEISFAKQAELEKSLADLLPPKEVLLSVNFLLQDANNVFEMTSTERVQVFKHLFGLLGIDHAKESLRDKRRDIQTRINIQQDDGKYTSQLQTHLQNIQEYQQNIMTLDLPLDDIQKCIQTIFAQDFFADLALIKDDVQIEHFRVDVDISVLDTLWNLIQSSTLRGSSLEGKMDQLSQQKQRSEQEFTDLQKVQQEKQQEMRLLQKKISWIDEHVLQQLKDEKKILLDQQALLEQKHTKGFYLLGTEVAHLVDAVRAIDNLVAEGKELKATRDTLQLKIEQYHKQQEQSRSREEQLNKQLEILHQDYAEQSYFRCEKIEGDCPYVEMIKWASMKVLQKQTLQVEEQLQSLQKEQWSITRDDRALWEETLKEQEGKTKKIRDVLKSVQRQDIQSSYDQWTRWEIKHKALDRRLLEQEQKNKEWDTWKQELISIQTALEWIDQQLKEKKHYLAELREQKLWYEQEKKSLYSRELQQLSSYLQQVYETIQQLERITKEYKEMQVEVAQLKEQEKMVKELYTIFSKELLLVVLQDFLPMLEEVMNTYLAEMVDYEVRFQLPQEMWEKIELQIDIIDEKGMRSVKSLSGGQKSVLKIAWILAVSMMMKGNFLFLDETITSMDAMTIAKVADVLEDFVRQHEMKFYVVTHSPQIQDMAIWDEIISLEEKW